MNDTNNVLFDIHWTLILIIKQFTEAITRTQGPRCVLTFNDLPILPIVILFCFIECTIYIHRYVHNVYTNLIMMCVYTIYTLFFNIYALFIQIYKQCTNYLTSCASGPRTSVDIHTVCKNCHNLIYNI